MMSWSKRLGVLLSFLWIVFWFVGYYVLDLNTSRTQGDILIGLLLFGLIPVILAWLIWWVVDGLQK